MDEEIINLLKSIKKNIKKLEDSWDNLKLSQFECRQIMQISKFLVDKIQQKRIKESHLCELRDKHFTSYREMKRCWILNKEQNANEEETSIIIKKPESE